MEMGEVTQGWGGGHGVGEEDPPAVLPLTASNIPNAGYTPAIVEQLHRT